MLRGRAAPAPLAYVRLSIQKVTFAARALWERVNLSLKQVENVGTDKRRREQKHYVVFALSPAAVSYNARLRYAPDQSRRSYRATSKTPCLIKCAPKNPGVRGSGRVARSAGPVFWLPSDSTRAMFHPGDGVLTPRTYYIC